MNAWTDFFCSSYFSTFYIFSSSFSYQVSFSVNPSSGCYTCHYSTSVSTIYSHLHFSLYPSKGRLYLWPLILPCLSDIPFCRRCIKLFFALASAPGVLHRRPVTFLSPLRLALLLRRLYLQPSPFSADCRFL